MKTNPNPIEKRECIECSQTTAPITVHKEHQDILEAIDEINYGEVLKSNVFVKDKFEIKGKVSKLVENGEVIESFREKFNELVVKESSGEYYAMILPKDIHEDDEYSLIDIEAFITNALNQQRRNTIKEVINEIARDKYWLDGNFNEKEFSNRLKEFLTKLEEEK